MSWPDISEFPLYFLRMAKIALFGDSYIKRLGKYLGVPGECRFFGVGGMRADRPHQEVLNQLLEFQPDTVFVFIGGNDISVNSSPRQTFDDIVNIMDSIDNNVATTVYIGEILTRGQFSKSPGLTKDIFDRKRKLINKKLKKKYGRLFVTFPDIHFPDHYDKNNVHLNSTRTATDSTHTSVPGKKKFQCRIARVLCRH